MLILDNGHLADQIPVLTSHFRLAHIILLIYDDRGVHFAHWLNLKFVLD